MVTPEQLAQILGRYLGPRDVGVDDSTNIRRKWAWQDIEADNVAPHFQQAMHERLAKMAGTSCD